MKIHSIRFIYSSICRRISICSIIIQARREELTIAADILKATIAIGCLIVSLYWLVRFDIYCSATAPLLAWLLLFLRLGCCAAYGSAAALLKARLLLFSRHGCCADYGSAAALLTARLLRCLRPAAGLLTALLLRCLQPGC